MGECGGGARICEGVYSRMWVYLFVCVQSTVGYCTICICLCVVSTGCLQQISNDLDVTHVCEKGGEDKVNVCENVGGVCGRRGGEQGQYR